MWVAVGLTWLVTIGLVAVGTLRLREEVRAQILSRDRELLVALTQAQTEAPWEMGVWEMEEGLDVPLEGGMGEAEHRAQDLLDGPFMLMLTSASLDGIIAAALYDAEGEFVRSIPEDLVPDRVPADIWDLMREGVGESRYDSARRLGDIFLPTPDRPAAGLEVREPLVEVYVPLQDREGGNLVGVARYTINGRGMARDFQRLDRELLVQAGGAVGVAWLVTGVALVGSFRRLDRANRRLAGQAEDLRRLNRDLDRSARVAALGAVTAHLMHALKTPVSGLHSLMTSRVGGDDVAEGMEIWQEALAATERMKGLIGQVSSVLQDHADDLGYVVTLRDIAASVVHQTRGHRHAGRVTVEVKAETEAETGDEGRVDHRTASLLTLILVNLTDNAIEATPAGGKVKVCLKGGMGTGKGTICEVSDGGSGVPPDRLARLFEPQASGKPGGSGLGLAITRQLVLALGGTISLVTTGPQGSLFRVELPSAVGGVASEAEDG